MVEKPNMILCRLHLHRSATPEQLKKLATVLRRWCAAELDDGECCPEVDRGNLKDLRAGELPKPDVLQFTEFLYKMLPDGLDADTKSALLGQLKQELDKDASRRAVLIYIECSAGFGCRDAVHRLEQMVPKGLLERVEIKEMASDPELDDAEDE